MKKIVLTLAGALAATAFAPEAAAIPSFARQTGMACTACHFQHFPVLNSFGMAFKAAGYTMMGAQGKVEGEHLSIPDTLNMSALIKLRYQKTNGADTAATNPQGLSGVTTNGGQWQIPDELALFVGGRVAENIGTLAEISLAGATTAGGATIAQIKFPIVFDMGAQISVIPFTTDSGSMGYGYELSSSGLVRALRWTEERSALVPDFIGMSNGAATGIALVAKNDMGYINFTRWSPNFTASGNSAIQMRSNWLRIAATPTVADWNMHIGLGVASGTNYVAGGLGVTCTGAAVTAVGTSPVAVTCTTATIAAQTQTDTKATILDFQGQTQLGGKDFSLYASYARAPGQAAATVVKNKWNTNANTKTAFGIGADYSVIPHVLSLGGAILRGDNGKTSVNKDNAILLQAVYDLTQNVALHAVYKHNSGNKYTAGAATNRTTLMLETSW